MDIHTYIMCIYGEEATENPNDQSGDTHQIWRQWVGIVYAWDLKN